MLPSLSQRFSQQKSGLDDLFTMSNQQEVISFAAGYPASELFPKEQLDQAFVSRSKNAGQQYYQYGSVLGVDSLRKKILTYVHSTQTIQAKLADIMLTQGAQQGISLLADLFLDVGDGVVVEGPTYIGALEAFKVRKPTFYEVQLQADGLDIEQLETLLSKHPIKLLYTIPNFQNPTGCCMSLAKRQRLAQLASQYSFLVIEDDPYRELRYAGQDLPSIKSFDKAGNVVTLGSFSKILSPALRMGWLVADEALIKQLSNLRLANDCQPSNVVAEMIDQYLSDNDLVKHIQNLNRFYKDKKETMVKYLKRYLPKECQISDPDGGFFIWVTLPAQIDAHQLLLQNGKVTFIESSGLFAVSGQKNHMRLNFSGVTKQQIKQGCQALGDCLAEMLHTAA